VLDSEILATLNAIRSKDPRVYDKNTTFFTSTNEDAGTANGQAGVKKEKPMYLRDYHRENLLNGVIGDTKEAQDAPMTYNQEQEALKRSIVGEINAVAEDDVPATTNGDVSGDEEGFLVTKPRQEPTKSEQPYLNVENADKDPETFLSSFMAARAWVPTERSHFQPFESDDEEEDRRAEEFEEAYNFRFEDPAKSNEKLVSHARDIASRYSVRREEKKPRQKQREAEGERKEAEKRERAEERARLRKLKIEEAEEKLKKIKKAAGLRGGSELSPKDWARFLDADWDDGKWEYEMRKRFGEAYYAQVDTGSDEDVISERPGKKGKPRKPKWADDIDIKDLIPDFDEGDAQFEITDEDEAQGTGEPEAANYRKRPSEDHKKDREEKKKSERKDRRIIEQLVDNHLELDTALSTTQQNTSGFRYRATSPLSFGLSARDILMADDSQLNEYAGLKKLAAFRDPNKKKKDEKRLGKKARLRKWRKDTFGDEEGPRMDDVIAPGIEADMDGGIKADKGESDVDIQIGPVKKKRRRSKKGRGGGEVVE
jgi:protein KRI1